MREFTMTMEKAEAVLEKAGITDKYSKPLLFEILWLFNAKIRPPHFNSFFTNFKIVFTFMTIGWWFGMLAFMWEADGFFALLSIAMSVVFGLGMGLSTACYYHFSAVKHQLPSWDEL